MDNHLPPFPTDPITTTTPSSIPILIPPNLKPHICDPLGMGFYSSAHSYYFTTPHELMQFPSSYPWPTHGVVGNESANSLPNVISRDEERRFLDAWSTKVARSKRRLARQRSLSSSRGSPLPAFVCSDDSKGLLISSSDPQNNPTNRNRNLYTFCTPDKKILRMLLTKELKNSDVGSLGRIVLPKREAEENLPTLSDKEGIQVVIRDVNSHKKWAMKYKYWANNRSRMYVLENTGDFVRQNGLVIGDSMTLYEDECKNLYVAVQKGEKSGTDRSSLEETETKNGDVSSASYTNYMDVKDEEEASLALLIEELKHKAEEETSCNLMVSGNVESWYSFERGCYISRRQSAAAMERAPPQPPPGYMRGRGKEVEDHYQANGFEDCFGGLDTLPEVSGYKHPLFEYLSNDGT